MKFRLLGPVLAAAVLFTSCTPAFSVLLFNHSEQEIVVMWQSQYPSRIPANKVKIVGTAWDYSSGKDVIVISGDRAASFRPPYSLWNFPRESIRTIRFPAAAGSREACLEFGRDGRIYVLNAKSLGRLKPQPKGFPLEPRSVPKLGEHPDMAVVSYQASGYHTHTK